MGTVRRVLIAVFATMVMLVLSYLGPWTVGAWRQGYTWREMDWSRDGSTSLAEFLSASDIGKRVVQKDGKKCTEYTGTRVWQADVRVQDR